MGHVIFGGIVFGTSVGLGMDNNGTGQVRVARSLGRTLLLLGREVRDGFSLRRRVTACKTRGAAQATCGAGGEAEESQRSGLVVVASLYYHNLDEGGKLIIESALVDRGIRTVGWLEKWRFR